MNLPLPPKDAVTTETVCQFCNVGCGYTVYTWPEGHDGGAAADENALGVDFRSPQPALTGVPYTAAMVSSIEARDGRRSVAIVPAAGSPINVRRDHSARGGANAQTTFSRRRRTGERLTHPLLRVGDSLVPVTWTEAIEVLARVLVGVRDRDGVDAICAKAFDHGGGGGGFENNFGVGKLLFTGLGTKMVGIHNRPAYNSEVWGSRDRGVHELHYTAADTRLCDTLVLWGANTYETATALFTGHILPNFQGGTADEKRETFEKGEAVEPLRVIVIDPRRTSTLTYLESLDPERVLHLRPNPGTDLVVADAIARVVWEKRWHDAAMLANRTDAVDFEAYVASNLGGKATLKAVLADAERITGVPAADLVRAAEWTCKPKSARARRRTLTLYEKGVIWNLRNHDTVASVVQLSVLGGHIGRPGTGCGRQGGHQEGYVRPDYPGSRPPINVDQHLIDGGGKVLWVMGTNPYLTTPRAQEYRGAMHARTVALTRAIMGERGGEPATPRARADAIVKALDKDGLFLVVSELYLTDTARDAHLVLPAAGWGEMDLTSINCNSRLLRLYGKFMDPPGVAIPDWEICARVARRMEALYAEAGKPAEAARFTGFDWQTGEDVFLAGGATFPDNRVDELGAESLPCETYTGVTYASLRALGQAGIATPVRRDPATGALIGTTRRYGQRFGSADGKFHWAASGGWTGYPAEVSRYLDKPEQWPFWLTTGRCQRMWQSGYHDARQPEKMAEVPLPYVELHPDDAAKLSVDTGDLVEVYNDEGNLVAQARVVDSPPPGMVFALLFHPFGTSNDLTSAYTDPKTTIPWYKGARAAMRKLDGDVGDARETISRRRTNDFR